MLDSNRAALAVGLYSLSADAIIVVHRAHMGLCDEDIIKLFAHTENAAWYFPQEVIDRAFAEAELAFEISSAYSKKRKRLMVRVMYRRCVRLGLTLAPPGASGGKKRDARIAASEHMQMRDKRGPAPEKAMYKGIDLNSREFKRVFNINLRLIAKQKGTPLKYLSESIGRSPAYFDALKRGVALVNIAYVQSFAKRLCINVNFLITLNTLSPEVIERELSTTASTTERSPLISENLPA